VERERSDVKLHKREYIFYAQVCLNGEDFVPFRVVIPKEIRELLLDECKSVPEGSMIHLKFSMQVEKVSPSVKREEVVTP
jgi:hypothetical protein